MYYWDKMTHSPFFKIKHGFDWQTFLMTLLTFVAPLTILGLVHGCLENACNCCIMGNSFKNAWRLHAPVLLLLVLTQKSNMSQDLSAMHVMPMLDAQQFARRSEIILIKSFPSENKFIKNLGSHI